MNEEFAKRNKEIFRLRNAGMTYAAIGLLYKISAERAREIYLRIERRDWIKMKEEETHDP